MKEHIISYLLKNDKWWSSLNITNHSFYPTSVLIEYYSSTGSLVKTEEISLAAKCQNAFLLTTPPLGWARALSGDNVTIMEFFGSGYGVSDPFQSVVIQPRDVIVKNITYPCTIKTAIRNTSFTEDMCNCKYFNKEFSDIIEHIGRAVFCRYSIRAAKKLEVIDGSPQSDSDCPEHPAGSHRFGDAADFHYFTHGATNHTQRGTPLIPIWTNGLLNSNFDKERNADFLLMLCRIFPVAHIAIDQRIKDSLAIQAWGMYGESARQIILARVQGDAPELYNHHLHMHVNYTGDSGGVPGYGYINWESSDMDVKKGI